MPTPTAIPSGFAYSDLDGVLASDALAHALPMALMVEDEPVARPQSGFSTASIVYQAMADGGEDRYMFVFQENSAADIGPMRSTRPYYVYWAAEYKALFGHVGGDMQSLLQTIPAMSRQIYNMDDLNGGHCPYHRITTRYSPHNDYTNSADLIRCAAALHYPATYQGLPVRPFKSDTPFASRSAAQIIYIPYRTGTVDYQFDPNTDTYARYVDGERQVDPANNQLVNARNIIVMYQVYDMVPSMDHERPVVVNEGTGKAIVFEEGKAIEATWKKSSNTDLTRFYDQSGQEIPLVRGEIFIQSVPMNTQILYT